MKTIDHLIRDSHLTALLKSTQEYILKEGTEVNKIYDRLKKGKLDLLIPENFNYPTSQKNITLSFDHCRSSINTQNKVLKDESLSDINPDILAIHKIKVPTGYEPKTVVLNYQVYTEAQDTAKINFKVGKKEIHINPSQDGLKKPIGEQNHDSKNYILFDGNLDINLSNTIQNDDRSTSYLNENNEIPFSIFIQKSKHYSFHILIKCERQESVFKDWKLNTYNQLKEEYKTKKENYERQFFEKLKQFSESEIQGITSPHTLNKKVVL